MSLICIPIYLHEWERGEAIVVEQDILILYMLTRVSWEQANIIHPVY